MIGIIPAAGSGIRFKELGRQYSKTILPYKEKPILIYQIEWLKAQGCDDIRIVINHQEETIKEILKFYKKEKEVTLYHQKEKNGLSGAVYSAIEKEKNDFETLILLGDLIITDEKNYSAFNDNFISVGIVPDYSRWCMVELKDDKVIKFIDKPRSQPDTNYAVSGLYRINQGLFLQKELKKQLKSNDKISNEYQLSGVLQKVSDKYGMKAFQVDHLNFGTLEEYLNNRSVKISRSFNDIEVEDNFIIKSSVKEREKLIKEYNWFNNLPDEIKVLTPRIFDYEFYREKTYYKMEKILAPSLREIYLFLDSSKETWNNIFQSLFSTLSKMENYGRGNKFLEFVVEKTENRIKDIEIAVENKMIRDFMNDLNKISKGFSRSCLMHGDFCFSNILYDFKSSSLKIIDPRGELFGDHYYEVAKIAHSVLYDYDFIDAELYVFNNENDYKIYNNGKSDVKELFKNLLSEKYTNHEIRFIKMLTASLFLSMIPLHSHNRTNQKIYYDTFKKIYEETKI